jgi:hypothetical protein
MVPPRKSPLEWSQFGRRIGGGAVSGRVADGTSKQRPLDDLLLLDLTQFRWPLPGNPGFIAQRRTN